jgi:parvulin-like peptidyl-prolyl isomerase
MYRLFLNLILIFAFSSALISQESKPANTNSTASPAPASTSAAASTQASPAKAAGANQAASPAPNKTEMKEEEAEAQAPKPPAKPAPVLPATTPVITLNFCKGAAASKSKTTAATKAPEAANCKTVITKAEFDKVLDAAIPKNRRPPGGDVPQQVRQAVAKEYLNIYIMAREAEKRGFPAKDPTTQEMLKLSRMQVLSVALNQELQEKAKPTDAQVEQYYKDNPSAFVEVSLRRLYIPKPPQTPPAPTITNAGANAANANNTATNNTPANPPKPDPEAQKAALEAQKATAEKFRERAIAGEDLDKLEKEAFEAISSKQTPPQTQMGNRRRGIMPPDQDTEIFSLEPGHVSKLFDNPGGWYVFKVESKRTIPFNEAKEEIQRKLQPENFKDVHEAIISSVKSDLNDKYFGPPAPAGAAVGKTQPTPTPSRPSAVRPQAAPGAPKPASTADAKSQPTPKAADK